MNEESIFSRALEIPLGSEREQFLQSACHDDPPLRKRIEELLAQHENPDSIFRERASRPEDATTAAEREANVTPDREKIGNYRLLHVLGEGGMGTVYQAEQQHPVRRRVAVKVIKHGMNNRQFIARFEAERQALAMMDHPNIAKVLDAGCTKDGRPYFVMELVKGIPITEFCDQNRLSTTERLNLFVQVCQAVQHAHQKGIIHRDLKPGNVLVAMYDNLPVPKVIDFGVAKATHQPLTDHTLCTIPGQIVGTWEYMSPEQAILNQLDVDTRTDIYSLGVILYELLTGKTPLDLKSLKPEALEERLRRIREEEPSRPSLRVSSLGQAGAAMAAYRNAEAAELARSLKGDLDWIVMKALEKDRAKRYETASGFAAEIGRYLNDEPLSFRPPSSWEQFGRFYRRRKALVITFTAVALALLTGFGFAWWGFRKAQRALSELRLLLIEQGVQQSLLGELDQVEDTIALAEEADVEQDWILTMQGAAALHQGDNLIAQSLLERAVDMNPQNVSAKAMLSIAYFHSGEIENWQKLMVEFPSWKIRPEFEELDRLFRSYALIYRDWDQARTELRSVLEARPAWDMAKALLAVALAETAQYEGEHQFAREALQEINAPLSVAKDNPFVMMITMFVYEVGRRMLDDEREVLDARATEVVKRLESHVSYNAGLIMVAGHYDLLPGHRDDALTAWRRLLKNSRSFFRSRAMAELYRENRLAEVLGVQPKDSESAIAQAYVLASIPGRRQDALEVYRHYAADPTWYTRFQLLQLLLLLQEPELARQKCREWIAPAVSSEGTLNSDDMRKKLIEFLAGERPALDPNTKNVAHSFDIRYISGLLAYANEEKDRALRLMDECCQSRGQSTEHHWAKAFSVRWREDPSAEKLAEIPAEEDLP